MALPDKLKEVKYSLSTKYPWLTLLQFNVNDKDDTIVRVVRNNETVIYQGNEYIGFPFELGMIQQNIEGEIQSSSLSVSGVTYAFQKYIEANDGCLDATIILTIVHADNLSENYAELEQHWNVLSTHVTATDIQFTIGAPSPLLQRFPLYRFFSDMCSYKTFKGPKCGYSGSDETCDRRWSTCRIFGNSARFGGVPGIRRDSVRFV